MRCQRCRGLMVLDHFLDMKDGAGGIKSKLLHLVDRWSAKWPRVPEVVSLSA
jgi:hypothetical protein